MNADPVDFHTQQILNSIFKVASDVDSPNNLVYTIGHKEFNLTTIDGDRWISRMLPDSIMRKPISIQEFRMQLEKETKLAQNVINRIRKNLSSDVNIYIVYTLQGQRTVDNINTIAKLTNRSAVESDDNAIAQLLFYNSIDESSLYNRRVNVHICIEW
jgi:hypothetical protein